MAYITKTVHSELVDINGTRTLIMDQEKTKELELSQIKFGLSFDDIEKYKSQFLSHQNISNFLNNAEVDTNFINDLEKKINDVEAFYEILWNRIRVELIFLTNWYTKEIINPESFYYLSQNNKDFQYWYVNNVEYNFINKIKRFYFKLAKAYANRVSIEIYEQDVEAKVKEVMFDIEELYMDEIKNYLKYEWSKALDYQVNVYERKMAERRRAKLFD